jgi:Lar family restriction alleviation protein
MKSTMTNGERFTTAPERIDAFGRWCSCQQHCDSCPVGKMIECNKRYSSHCALFWLDLKYETVLKPCPFCGSEASLWSGTEDHYVLCRNEDCAASLVARSFSSEEEAIYAWNRRAK